MSIAIKNIDMPKPGEMIVIAIRQESAVIDKWDITKEAEGQETFIKRARIKEADITQIPTKHGRLIDAKLLKDTIKDSIPTYTGREIKIITTYGDLDLMDKIDMMPTILEAEG